jgi:uncharacterized protein YajQ (UPF0234 family)
MRPIRAVERGPVDGCWMVSRVRFGHAREHRSVKESVVADASFDIVSKVDRQEADNALNQAAKELSQRFDFRGTDSTIAWAGEEGITITSSTEERCKAAVEVFKEKLVKRGISLRAFDVGEPAASGKTYRATGKLVQGIASDKAKIIVKKIKDEGPRGVQAQVQGDQLRVTGKKRDDLQAVIALLKNADLDIALQFTNYR